ncbi:hypothetical protein OPV22_023806 [Ensete ventricosum]|uniref:Uncharacterized protein n=1 Tax=Ensete ventricosum TaxID=4639 RepID=A0AAV8QIW6_ENSVE|nr:hypothetical protein OPV22_023806 [Ensete ventricosum]
MRQAPAAREAYCPLRLRPRPDPRRLLLPRTVKMPELLSDSARFGQLKTIHSILLFAGDSDFLENDICVMPELDALGALGDVGCQDRSQLILSCGSSLLWKDGKVSTLSCGSSLMRGSLQLGDFVIPFEEEKVPFSFASGSAFNGLVTGWQPLPAKHIVPTDLPQESLIVQAFSRLAGSIIDSAGKPDDQWPAITSNRQLIVRGCVPVEIV